jgi:hypothetical protein
MDCISKLSCPLELNDSSVILRHRLGIILDIMRDILDIVRDILDIIHLRSRSMLQGCRTGCRGFPLCRMSQPVSRVGFRISDI